MGEHERIKAVRIDMDDDRNLNEETDLVVFTDEDGNEIELEVLDYFFYNGEEYAILLEPGDECDCGCGCEECSENDDHDVYIMKVVAVGEDEEEFIPIDEDKFDEISAFVEANFFGEDEDEDDEPEGE